MGDGLEDGGVDEGCGKMGNKSEVDHFPQKEVPYPISNGGQQFRRASGSCPSIPLHIC